MQRGKAEIPCAKTVSRCGCRDPSRGTREPHNHTPNKHHDAMTNLDMLLLKGASSKNPEESLRELRYAILTDGIPANSDGMVRTRPQPLHPPEQHPQWRCHTPQPPNRYL